MKCKFARQLDAPRATANSVYSGAKGYGYFEDRRPASNADPYRITGIIVETYVPTSSQAHILAKLTRLAVSSVAPSKAVYYARQSVVGLWGRHGVSRFWTVTSS